MKYIALTIGPIYKTLQNAKKPKELFASSYVFSYIMREIIRNFKSREFVTPYIKNEDIFKDSDIGLFHDRFIFKSQEDDLKKLKVVIDDVISNLANELNIDSESIINYLQINYDEYVLKDSDNPILEITPYLDALELFYQTTQDNSFADKLRRQKGDRDNFLTQDKNIIDDLKKLSYNNYFCVVHADGDNMGKAIAKKENIEEVSKNLFNYCQDSHKKIKNFGGQTIFAGGDDLLFFAPVVSKKTNKTIFQLCEDIGDDFKNRFNGVSTLSFGVSVNYLKFPLYEALENSRELLFDKAKNEQRDNIAFKVTKHSGQSFEAIVHKGNYDVYTKFLDFVSNITKDEDNSNFLHSLHHKIDTYKSTLELIIKDRAKLENFFENYFNEDEHKQYREFFDTLIDFMHTSQDLDLVYATLRFIKFIKGDK